MHYKLNDWMEQDKNLVEAGWDERQWVQHKWLRALGTDPMWPLTALQDSHHWADEKTKAQRRCKSQGQAVPVSFPSSESPYLSR